MTRERDIEHLLDTWFRDGPTEAPDRIVDAVADRIGRQSQRPAWRLEWRHVHMTSTVKLATALAAVAIVAFLGWRFLPGSSGGVGGDPAPSSSPSASASPSILSSSTPVACEDDLAGCAGPLAAGNHRSNRLVPAISFETPANWKNVIDLPALYKIDPPGFGSPNILVWADAAISDQATNCSPEPDPDLGRTAADWIAFVTSHPGLDASEPVDVDFDGRTGQQVEVTVAADWTATCPNHEGPYVMFLTQTVDGQRAEYGVPSDQRLLLTVVDVAGRTLVIESYGPIAADAFASSIGPARDIIASFRFD